MFFKTAYKYIHIYIKFALRRMNNEHACVYQTNTTYINCKSCNTTSWSRPKNADHAAGVSVGVRREGDPTV